MQSVFRILADDLTGAADAGVAFAGPDQPVRLVLSADQSAWSDSAASVVAIDLDTRDSAADAAGHAVRNALGPAPRNAEVLVKIDSAMRGEVGAHIAAAITELAPQLVVVAPAFPAADRTTRDGIQWAGSRPVAEVVDSAAPASLRTSSVVDSVQPVSSSRIPLEVVQAGLPELSRRLAALVRTGVVAICDATEQTDLVRIVTAARATAGRVLWVGSAGLAHALARRSPAAAVSATTSFGDDAPRGPLLAVLGSASPVARRQAVRLEQGGAHRIEVDAHELVDASPTYLAELSTTVRAALGRAPVVVHLGHQWHIDSQRVSRSLAALTKEAAAAAGVLVLTGGQTARAVLQAQSVGTLLLDREIAPGVVLSRRPVGDGHIITKAGSFGTDRTLYDAVLGTVTEREIRVR